MFLLDIFFTGIGLSMDAVAVSICNGLTINNSLLRKALIISFYFGFFQFIMPLIGYFFGNILSFFIINIDHWIAFIFLFLIGINMIRDSFYSNNDITFNYKRLFTLAIATSIDALSIGITFSFFNINIFSSSIIIGVITFFLSFIGVLIGYYFGSSFHRFARILGGFILIFIGFKILFSHLF